MRAAGATVGVDGGGGGGVVTVNGIAPAGGNVVITASDIPSTGPSDVQADLDLLAASVATSVKKVESWDEFTGLAGTTEGPAGVWTYTDKIQAEGDIIATVGERAVQGVGGEISSLGPIGGRWVFDVDAPAFTGPIVMRAQRVTQLNSGASSRCLEVIQSGPTPTPVIQSCEFIGGNTSIEAHNILTAMILTDINMSFSDRGLFLRGAVFGVAGRLIGSNNGLGSFIAVEIDSTTVIAAAGGLVFEGCAFVLTTGQFGYAISHSASIASPALIQLSGASNLGPQEAMVRQTSPGVTDMAIDDDRLVIKGGTSVANWSAQAVADRYAPLDPLIVNNSGAGAGVPAVVPYEDGAGNLEIVASILSHFTLFKNGADPLDWYFEYTGPLTNATIRLTSRIRADRASAGPSEAILSWERAPFLDPGYGAFAAVPGSDSPLENENRSKASTALATFKGVNTGDRVRVVMSDSTATDIRLQAIQLDLQIGS